MRRREFVGLIGGAALWPAVARAQRQSGPVIGYLSSRSPDDSKPHLAGFLRGLEAFGYVDAKNVTIEYRWANGQYDRLPKMASELTDLRPAVIAAAGGAPSARAAKLATNAIPVVFVTSDSMQEGLVSSLNRPEANVTGVDLMSGEITGKRLELLAQIVPPRSTIAFLANPSGLQSGPRTKEAERAAGALAHALFVIGATSDAELDSSFAKLSKDKIGGLVVENDPFFDSRRERLIALAAQNAMPAIYHIREFPLGGGLMSYGANLADVYYQMGVQVGRVLKGASIADLPVVRPTKFDLTLNLKTAKALSLAVPPTLLALADEVID
jgi:putative tryptophan/tyrosine transport system substrate-binding protein